MFSPFSQNDLLLYISQPHSASYLSFLNASICIQGPWCGLSLQLQKTEITGSLATKCDKADMSYL